MNSKHSHSGRVNTNPHASASHSDAGLRTARQRFLTQNRSKFVHACTATHGVRPWFTAPCRRSTAQCGAGCSGAYRHDDRSQRNIFAGELEKGNVGMIRPRGEDASEQKRNVDATAQEERHLAKSGADVAAVSPSPGADMAGALTHQRRLTNK